MDEQKRKNPHGTLNRKYYQIPYNYDETTDGKEPLDFFLTDDTIIRLLDRILQPHIRTCGRSFYSQYNELAKVIFSQPYPMVAIDKFGYPSTPTPDGPT